MKRRTIYISLFLIFIIGIISLIGTFATDTTITEGNSSNADYLFNIALGSRTNREVVIPSYDSKVVDIKISNPNPFKMKYLLYLEGTNTNISVINIGDNESIGILNSNTTTLVKIFIQNNSNSNITTSIKDLVGFESDELSLPSNSTSIDKDNYYKVKVTSNNGRVKPNIKFSTTGGTLKYTLVPNTGYQYKSNTCEGSVSNNIMTISNITSNKNCTVEYEPITVSVSFNLDGGAFETTYTTPQEHVYTVPYTGNYKLEVWGAQGGSVDSTFIGGYGAYSTGNVQLNSGGKLYVNVGGQGTALSGSATSGGYNGGGSSAMPSSGSTYNSSGGGASHIAKNSGVLSSLSSNISNLLIVAGGGGGNHYHSNGKSYGGHGGGISGSSPIAVHMGSNNCTAPTGGTQNSGGVDNNGNADPGTFGLGGNYQYENGWGAGGGGGYYGGAAGGNAASCAYSGAGGSGYIGNSSLTNKVMYCYNCTESTATATKTVSTTNVSETAMSNYAKSGNGAARITLISDIVRAILYSQSYGDLLEPTKLGYTFGGWYTGANGTGTRITSSSVVSNASNHTLYAKWTQLPAVSVTLNLAGGTLSSGSTSLSVRVGQAYGTLPTPTRTGYTFDGWYSGTNGARTKVTSSTIVTNTSNHTIYASWTPNTYTISYNLNGGTSGSSAPTSGKYGSTVTVSNPTKSYYTFTGWTVSGTGSSMSGTSLTIGSANITLAANWEPNTYTISYNLNGGTSGSSAPTSGKYGSTVTVSNPTKSYYTFTGWTVSGTGASMSGTTLTIGTANITLTANWEPNTYTISYNLNGGTKGSSAPTSGKYGSTVTVSNPTKAHHTFAGWSVSGTGASMSGTTLTIGTSNITLTANWNVNSYYLDLNGFLDGASSGGIAGYGTADVYINNTLVCNDCTDYYTQHPYGTSYSISDIKSTSGHTYNGVHSGSLSGTISGATSVVLKFSTSRTTPVFTYTGSYQIVNDSNATISDPSTYTGNWKIRFLSSGTLTFSSLGNASSGIDIFVVGGGGAGAKGTPYIYASSGGGSGGGGAAITVRKLSVSTGTSYSIVVGGASSNSSFGAGSTAYFTALGGGTAKYPERLPPTYVWTVYYGSGGAGRLSGQTNNYGASSVVVRKGASGNGAAGNYEFDESGNKRYGAAGGKGAGYNLGITAGGADGGGNGGGACTDSNGAGAAGKAGGYAGKAGGANTGSGGGGGGGACGTGNQTYGLQGAGGSGGSGIVIIRNTRS